IDRDLLGQVAVGHGNSHVGDVADLGRQVAGHGVDVVGEVLPSAGHALDLGLAAELAVRADLAGHAGHFGGKGVELVHHRVHGVLAFQTLSRAIDGDLLGQVAAGHGDSNVGDVAHLRGQVAGHRVDVVGEIFPGAGHARNHGLAAELAVGADF